MERKNAKLEGHRRLAGFAQAERNRGDAVMRELARQRMMLLGLGACIAAVALTGGIERALFVPSEIVAALNADPHLSPLEARPDVAVATPETRQRTSRVLSLMRHRPHQTTGPVADVVADEPALPLVEESSVAPSDATGTELAYAEPSPPPAPDKPPMVGRGVEFPAISGAEIYGTTPVEPLPEPEVWAMMGSGLLVSVIALRRRRRQGQA
mgnify:CR=1 FL=1